MKEAPLFIHAYDLHGWLLDRLESGGEAHCVVRDTVLDHSRGLLAAVTLAVSRFDPGERLIEADEQATLLRVYLRLAAEKRLLDDRQLLHATEVLRDIGRQIGGWRKRLEEVR
jgi:hypothetical protein